jgi:sigma-B regulation protein RsbU (phosphoserine phosphatase)
LDYFSKRDPLAAFGPDFFDMFALDQSALVASIGTVSNPHMPACLITAGLRVTLRLLSHSHGEHLANLTRDLNRIIWGVSVNSIYATMFYGHFDAVREQLRYVNAGDQPALLIRAKRERMVRIEATATVLGLSLGASCGQRTMPLYSGDVFVGLTCGLSDVLDRGRPRAHESLILELVRQHRDAPARSLASLIVRAAEEIAGPPERGQDRTVLIVRALDVQRRVGPSYEQVLVHAA